MEQDIVTSSHSTLLTSNRESCRSQSTRRSTTTRKILLDQVSNTFQQLWQSYRNVVLTHRIPLELADEATDRLLFWMPYHENDGNGSQWREVVYGLLSLNRLSMHCAQQSDMPNSYGTTLRVDDPDVPATSIRIALSVIHCLMPTLLEMIGNSDPSSRSKRQTTRRLRLEQLKFALRLFLLASYWKQSLIESESSQDADGPGIMGIGILQDGGMYHVDQPPGVSLEEARAINKRHNYIGRRTGLKLTKEQSTPKTASRLSSLRNLMIGELLHILRPLYWASAEAQHYTIHQQLDGASSSSSLAFLKPWLVTLAMDLTSLGLLSNQRRNRWSIEEWNRRRMKLFLYLLRSPVWSRVTSPVLERSSWVIQKFPFWGKFIDAYLWDFIMYWKHPYVSEEG